MPTLTQEMGMTNERKRPWKHGTYRRHWSAPMECPPPSITGNGPFNTWKKIAQMSLENMAVKGMMRTAYAPWDVFITPVGPEPWSVIQEQAKTEDAATASSCKASAMSGVTESTYNNSLAISSLKVVRSDGMFAPGKEKLKAPSNTWQEIC
ncbi:uncharacterized protein EI90DRAFT_3285644 [Cantharellus anzutake]|uniref:uncharacterized protein n=1 Tax=Cantharellus anzutake TaxID=1750568 RepID=UPI0019048D40|nr:uncharacterized protein EI90DRAFT_3285644 [Cantharellus anzutake]KAF8341550.1 hypothetical protein EI90DRAFT_3285644 [Cantharellus anzutake]